MTNKPVICITPIKNEAWILERFLKCTLTWADHVVIADQCSTDSSREIALTFPKVTVIPNESNSLDEGARQLLLLSAARKICSEAIIFALDSDEFLSANVLTSPEWKTVLNSPPGSVFMVQTVNVAGQARRGWLTEGFGALGFVDDGSAHCGTQIHSVRVPFGERSWRVVLREIVLLHYQYTDWDRMRSKHRWYECWEALNNADKSPVKIYRQYHHMDSIDKNSLTHLQDEWLQGYEEMGIDMTSVLQESAFWWDAEVFRWLQQYGAAKFKKCDIWEKDWNLPHSKENQRIGRIVDPRSFLDKAVLAYLRRTQAQRHTLPVKVIDRFLRFFW